MSKNPRSAVTKNRFNHDQKAVQTEITPFCSGLLTIQSFSERLLLALHLQMKGFIVFKCLVVKCFWFGTKLLSAAFRHNQYQVPGPLI
jgi:hypothetical protein